jgi:hypothetical protein
MGFKEQFKEGLGYDRKQLWWYRDLALGSVSAFAATFIAGTFISELNRYNIIVGIVNLVVFLVCLKLTPNWGIPFGMGVGWVAFSGWYGALIRGDARGYWVGAAATIVFILFVRKYGMHPTRTT